MGEFLGKTPFLRLFLFLTGGVLLGSFVQVSIVVSIVTFIIGVALFLSPFYIKQAALNFRLRWLFGLGTFLMFAIMGLWLVTNYMQQHILPFDGHNGVFELRITDEPEEKTNSILCKALVIRYEDGNTWRDTHRNIVAYFYKDSISHNLKYGDVLLVKSTFSKPRLNGNPEVFDYGTYLLRKGIGGTGYVAPQAWHKIGESQHFSLFRLAYQSRNYLLGIYQKMNITGDEFGLLAALTLGYKDALSDDMQTQFRNAGATHVLAVSGLHVGIIYVILKFLFGFMDKKKRLKPLKVMLILTFLWFYAFITGLPPSVCRAALMFSIMTFAPLISRKSNTYNSIFFSAFLLVLIRPTILFDVGFQLSYSAVLAIVYFQPKMDNWLDFSNKVWRWMWTITTVSLAAQIGTAPFVLYYFHQFANYFWLSNFLVIPAAAIAIYGAVLLFAVSPIPYVNVAVAFGLKWFLWVVYKVITLINLLPHGLTVSWIDGWQLFVLYLAVVALLFVFYCFKFSYVAIFLNFLILFLGLHLFEKIQNMQSRELVIFSNSKCLAVNRLNYKNNVVWTTDSTIAQSLGRDFWLSKQAVRPYFKLHSSLACNAFTFNNESYLILRNDSFKYKKSISTLTVDYLIFDRGIYPDEKLFIDFIHPKHVITSSRVYPNNNLIFKSLSDKFHFKFYAVRDHNAYKKVIVDH